MKVYNKAILPKNFKANGIASGIKKSGKLDLALFYSEIPAKAACRFTTNKLPCQPIKLNKINLAHTKRFQALLANSGNANSFTAKAGFDDARAISKKVAEVMSIKKESVLLASTGIIARRLPVAKITKAIPKLACGLSTAGIDRAKRAIMTTDTFAKEITVRLTVGRRSITICGVAKGAGMISPQMATMLSFILTDANISQAALETALRLCVEKTFNCMTVDGCMSTNDSVMALANGAGRNTLISPNKNFHRFLNALNVVCLRLAKMIVADAEGATKFIEIEVSGARNFTQARKAALAVANSNLFKTAMFAENPNFGRIVAAVGASGIEVNEKLLKIKATSLKRKEIAVKVDLAAGRGECTIYTCDLTPKYIKINAEY